MSRTEDANPIRIPRGPAEQPENLSFGVEDTVFNHGCDISVMKRKISELREDVKHMQTAMLIMAMYMLIMAMYMLMWIVGWGFGWW